MALSDSRLSNIRFKLPEQRGHDSRTHGPMKKSFRRAGLWLAAAVIAFAVALWSWRFGQTGDTAPIATVVAEAGAPAVLAASEGTSGVGTPTSMIAEVPPASRVGVAPRPGGAPPLQLSLRGVLATGATGRAIVAGTDGREYVVSVGSRVGADASVLEIHEDHLLVRQGVKSRVVRLQAASAPVSEVPSRPLNRVVTASGVSIDVDRLAAEGVESLTAAEKSAAIGANLVIDDSAEAVIADAAASASPGNTATPGETGQRFVKNRPR